MVGRVGKFMTCYCYVLAADKTIPWSKLNPTLYATTFLAMRDSHSCQCSIFIELDHKDSESALYQRAKDY